LTHPQIGRDLLDKFAEQIKEHGVVERPPMLEGKSMHISVASSHKPKVHEPTPTGKAHARTADEAPDETDDDAEPETESAQEEAIEAAPVTPVPSRPEPKTGAASTGV
jgi:hypothetical protein